MAPLQLLFEFSLYHDWCGCSGCFQEVTAEKIGPWVSDSAQSVLGPIREFS